MKEQLSFSKRVKQEICSNSITNPCCITAASYAIACFGRRFDSKGIALRTENAFIAQWAKAVYQQTGVVGKVYAKGTAPAKSYEFAVLDSFEIEKSLALFGHIGDETSVRIHPENFNCEGCFANFVAAAFVTCGILVDPEKGYNLEFVSSRYGLCKDFETLLQEKGFAPKYISRKGNNVLYFKASEQIEDMLTFMGSTSASLKIMNQKVYKDFRNKANRIANCENANIDKIVAANQTVLCAIDVLQKNKLLGALPKPLQEAACLRLQNPELSLQELTTLFEEPVSKSGLSHRYRKIQQIAQQYAQRQERECHAK